MANELRVAAAALLTQNLVRHNESESKLEPRTKPRHYLFPNRQVQVSLVANDHVYKPQRQQHPSSPEMSGGGGVDENRHRRYTTPSAGRCLCFAPATRREPSSWRGRGSERVIGSAPGQAHGGARPGLPTPPDLEAEP